MSTEDFLGEERRRYGHTIVDIENLLNHKLHDHEEKIQLKIVELIDQLKDAAFPGGVVKHSEYHLAKIVSAKEEAEFWKAAKMELTKGGVSAVLWVIKTVLILAGVGLMYKFGLGGLVGMAATK